ncbi:hypothetical protein COLO4_02527 [Corchorus olitorius]|uniref:Uncharacterized protein n=1 Tax=Corchorus olitorius TaxID=93759 RepID=A0A1R3L0S7_9ROSI|nr:hypothetical protein COLO4_02527 [Corchorus olitorius]
MTLPPAHGHVDGSAATATAAPACSARAPLISGLGFQRRAVPSGEVVGAFMRRRADRDGRVAPGWRQTPARAWRPGRRSARRFRASARGKTPAGRSRPPSPGWPPAVTPASAARWPAMVSGTRATAKPAVTTSTAATRGANARSVRCGERSATSSSNAIAAKPASERRRSSRTEANRGGVQAGTICSVICRGGRGRWCTQWQHGAPLPGALGQQRVHRQCHRRALQVCTPQKGLRACRLDIGDERGEEIGLHADRLIFNGAAHAGGQRIGEGQACKARLLRGIARQITRGIFEAGEHAVVHQRLKLRGDLLGAFQRRLFRCSRNHHQIAHIGCAHVCAQAGVERLALRGDGAQRGEFAAPQAIAVQHKRRTCTDEHRRQQPAQARCGRRRPRQPRAHA